MTPFQAFSVLFEEPAEPTPGDSIEALYLINRERAARGESPAIPHWWNEGLPRKPRPQKSTRKPP